MRELFLNLSRRPFHPLQPTSVLLVVSEGANLLVVGEVIVDFTLPQRGQESKLRLGGIVHGARGLWASNLPYAAAVYCPRYLLGQAKSYLMAHGCVHFIWLGEVLGAPNVMAIGDPKEISHQCYEDLLRDEKSFETFDVRDEIKRYSEILIFPGKFDLSSLRSMFDASAKFSFDIAYDVPDISLLSPFSGALRAIAISTSSDLFKNEGATDLGDLIALVKPLSPEAFLFKENRGGSRLFNFIDDTIEQVPAVLGSTVNSVGVGDVYSSVLVGLRDKGWIEAAWRGARAATYYSQTTFPDDFKRDVQRDSRLTIDALRSLGGTVLPWHKRPSVPIYFAGPEFSYVHKPELEKAIDSLSYHNFLLRRPVLENGELRQDSDRPTVEQMFQKDFALIKDCPVLFAVPLERDPGTLAEIGMAIAFGKPVVTYDPRNENNNAMIVGGSTVYSDDLDECLNGIFEILAKLQSQSS